MDGIYYILYPNFDLLVLTLLSWKGWSVDFFSAGTEERNTKLIAHFLYHTFSIEDPIEKNFVHYGKPIEALMTPLLLQLKQSGRLQVLSVTNIIRSMKDSYEVLKKTKLRQRCDYAPEQEGRFNTLTEEELRKELRGWNRKKDLQLIRQTEGERWPDGTFDTEHMSMVDDNHSFIPYVQFPYVHINAAPHPNWHNLIEELQWINNCIQTMSNELWLEASNKLSSLGLNLTEHDWVHNPTVLALMQDSLYRQFMRHDAKREIRFSPLSNASYILGVFLQCKEKLSNNKRWLLKQALHDVLSKQPNTMHAINLFSLHSFTSYASAYHALEESHLPQYLQFYSNAITLGTTCISETREQDTNLRSYIPSFNDIIQICSCLIT